MLERCIASLRAQTIDARIVIVDNGSKVPVKDRLPDVEVIRFETNRGFAAGANASLRASVSELVAIVNNDVVLEPSWAERLVRCFDDSRVAAAQSVILRPDGRIDSAGIEVRGGRFVQVAHGLDPDAAIPPREPWGVAGTAMMLRRSIFVDDDAFAEPLFAWYEDVDMAARLRAAGWSMALVREPLATHQGSATAAILPSRGEPMRVRNRYLVARSRAIGSVPALFLEDTRRIAGSIARLRFRLAATIARGVIDGLTSRKLPPLRVRSAPE